MVVMHGALHSRSSAVVVSHQVNVLTVREKSPAQSAAMGGWSSKTRLSAEDMQFLQTKTQLDQASIEVDRLKF